MSFAAGRLMACATTRDAASRLIEAGDQHPLTVRPRDERGSTTGSSGSDTVVASRSR